jgi:hypothetical protein
MIRLGSFRIVSSSSNVQLRPVSADNVFPCAVNTEHLLILHVLGIETSRVLKTVSVNAVLQVIDEDCLALDTLQSMLSPAIVSSST